MKGLHHFCRNHGRHLDAKLITNKYDPYTGSPVEQRWDIACAEDNEQDDCYTNSVTSMPDLCFFYVRLHDASFGI